jgi:hypothetical protein
VPNIIERPGLFEEVRGTWNDGEPFFTGQLGE